MVNSKQYAYADDNVKPIDQISNLYCIAFVCVVTHFVRSKMRRKAVCGRIVIKLNLLFLRLMAYPLTNDNVV